MLTASHRRSSARRLLAAWIVRTSPPAHPDVAAAAFDLAEGYALAPLAAAAVRANPAGHEALDARAQSIVAAQIAAQQVALFELAALVRLLDGAGIRTLVLKGGALLSLGHIAVGARHMDDIDVLVDPARASDVDDVLDAAGWSRIGWAEQPGVDGRPLAEHTPDGHHALIPRVSPHGALFDLHRTLPDGGALDPEAFEALLARASVATLRGVQVRCMDGADLAASICHHIVVHHRAEPRYLARHIADAVALQAAFGDDIFRQAPAAPVPSAAAARRMTSALLRAAEAISAGQSGGPLGPLVLPTGAPRAAMEQSWHAVAMAERLCSDAAHRPRVLASKLVPSRAYVAAEFGVDERAAYLPLLYVARIVTVPFGPLFRARS